MARNALSHERVITRLELWGVSTNEVLVLSGLKCYKKLNLIISPALLANAADKKQF
jgi:hypothetical protein